MPAPTTDAFNGTYGIHLFSGRIGPPLTATALWGEIGADGQGSIPGGPVSGIQNGTLLPPSTFASLDYTLAAGNRLAWSSTIGTVAEGGLSTDGSLASLAVVAPGSGAAVYLLARRDPGLSTASLNGTFHYAQFAASPTGAADAAAWGAVDFDGAGTATYLVSSNVDGVISGPGPATGTYAVAADGALTLTAGPTTTYRGTVTHGGDVGLFSGATAAGQLAAVGVFVKYSTAATDATFSGPYHLTSISADPALLPPSNWSARTGTISADAAGLWTGTSMKEIDDHGVLTTLPGPFIPSPYLVSPNGGMMLFGGGLGAVSSDGRFAAFVGGSTAGSGMYLWILIR